MTKKLLALAVAGAFAAPVAASAADNVTIYGTLNLSVDFTQAKSATVAFPGGGAGTITRPGQVPAVVQGVNADSTEQISCSSCNIGFRGEEDLGGGLKAWFQLESGIDPDEKTGTLTSRNSAIGLKGGWGTFLIGNWDTPYKKNINATTPFYATTTAAYNAIFGADGGNGVGDNPGTPFDNRQSNSVQYWSPKFAGGLGVNLMYSTRTDSSSATANNGDNNSAGNDWAWGASIVWEKGNLYAGAAYEQHNDVGAVQSPVLPSLDEQAYSFNVSYAFAGKYRVGAVFDNIEKDYNNAFGGTTSTDRNAYGIYAVLPVGPGAIHAWWAEAQDWKDRDSSGANFWAVGYYYNLSKRTQVYLQYAQVNNDDFARYRLGAGPGNRLIPSSGADPEAASIGMRHSF